MEKLRALPQTAQLGQLRAQGETPVALTGLSPAGKALLCLPAFPGGALPCAVRRRRRMPQPGKGAAGAVGAHGLLPRSGFGAARGGGGLARVHAPENCGAARDRAGAGGAGHARRGRAVYAAALPACAGLHRAALRHGDFAQNAARTACGCRLHAQRAGGGAGAVLVARRHCRRLCAGRAAAPSRGVFRKRNRHAQPL